MTRDVLPVPSPINIPDFTSSTALLARASLKTSGAARVLLKDYTNSIQICRKEKCKRCGK
jgi:hypothetical protein